MKSGVGVSQGAGKFAVNEWGAEMVQSSHTLVVCPTTLLPQHPLHPHTQSEMEDLCFAVLDTSTFCSLRQELDKLWSSPPPPRSR